MSSTIGERIYKARKQANLTQKELGVKCGVTAPAVTKWEAGESTPSRDSVIQIARATNISVQWLLFGVLPEHHANNTLPKWLREVRSVPILSFSEAVSKSEPPDDAPRAIVNFPSGPRSFAFELNNDSNVSVYPKKTLLILDPDAPCYPGCFVLGSRGEPPQSICGEFRQENSATGRITIVAPHNPKWPAARSDIESVEVIGVLTEAAVPPP